MPAGSNVHPARNSARFAEFLARLNYESYAVAAGLRDEANLTAVFKSYSDLFGKPQVLAERAAVGAAGSAEELRRARLRLVERANHYLSAGTQRLADEVETWKLRAELVFEGRGVAYHMAQPLLRNLPERGRRAELAEAFARLTASLRPLMLERWAATYDLVEDLCGLSYADAYAGWKQLPVGRLVALAKASLRATDDLYRRELDYYARRYVGVGAGEVAWFDFPRILRGDEWDEYFPAAGILPALRATAAGLRVGLERRQNIRLDLEPRPNKSPRAFCAGVRVPEEVYLVAKPSGGHRDYEEVLHEAGHAFHFGLTDPALPWELRCLLDDTVAETFAYQTAALLRSAEYLDARLGMPARDATAFAAYANFIELYMFRRYCAKTLYEAELHRRQKLELSSDLYALRMKEAVGVSVPGDFGLAEMDGGLYAFQYLSAWFLQASLNKHLVGAYGARWFESGGAGALLRGLWGRGATHDAESLLAVCGERALSAGPLLASFGLPPEARPAGPS